MENFVAHIQLATPHGGHKEEVTSRFVGCARTCAGSPILAASRSHPQESRHAFPPSPTIPRADVRQRSKTPSSGSQRGASAAAPEPFTLLPLRHYTCMPTPFSRVKRQRKWYWRVLNGPFCRHTSLLSSVPAYPPPSPHLTILAGSSLPYFSLICHYNASHPPYSTQLLSILNSPTSLSSSHLPHLYHIPSYVPASKLKFHILSYTLLPTYNLL